MCDLLGAFRLAVCRTGEDTPNGRDRRWRDVAVGLSQAGIDGDLETRDWSLERGTPRSCHDRGSTPMS